MKTNRQEMANEIEQLHAEGMAKLRAAYPLKARELDMVDQVSVELSNRMVSIGGNASTRKLGETMVPVKIGINARLHELNGGNLRQTYLHELAHIAVNVMENARCKHDHRWSAVMRAMGLSPDRCHKMNVDQLRATRTKRKNVLYRYECERCGRNYSVSARTHSKIRLGNATCHCNGKLNFVSQSEQLIG